MSGRLIHQATKITSNDATPTTEQGCSRMFLLRKSIGLLLILGVNLIELGIHLRK